MDHEGLAGGDGEAGQGNGRSGAGAMGQEGPAGVLAGVGVDGRVDAQEGPFTGDDSQEILEEGRVVGA